MTTTATAAPATARRRARERPPLPVLVLATMAIAFFALPFLGLAWRAPWGDAWSILTSESSVTALRLSLYCSLWATALAVVFGVPVGLDAGPRRVPRAQLSPGRCARCRWCCRQW